MTTTTSNLSIGQRILSETPIFFKIVQIAAFLVLVGVAVMVQFGFGSSTLHDMVGTAAFTVIAVAQCAAKDAQTLQAAPDLVTGFENLMPQILEQIGLVKDTLDQKPEIPGIVDAIKDTITASVQPSSPVINNTAGPAAASTDSIPAQ